MKKDNKKIHYFSGINGIKKLYTYIIKNWKPKDNYCIVSAPLESFTKLESFFLKTVHKKRINDKVSLKMIINNDARSFGYVRKKMPFTQIKFLDINTTSEYGVLNDLLFIVDYSKDPYGILIKDLNLANTFNNYFNVLWKQGRKIEIPPLIKTNKSIQKIILSYKSKHPLIIVDDYNYNLLRGINRDLKIVHIRNNNYINVKNIRKLIREKNHQLILGIGGCTALDIARACATETIPCILIPTILSTVCISVNKSVLNDKNKVKTFNTESPKKIIISIPDILSHRKEMIQWARAGFGDLFAKIGASIDVVYRQCSKTKDVLSLEKVRRNIPEVFDAMDYVLEQFNNYSKKDMQVLAVFLHEASVSVIIQDSFEFSGGAEHNLAYILEKKYLPKKIKIEHGVLVSVGALLEFKIFGEVTGNTSLYKKMRKVFEKVQLPTTYEELNNLGIKKKYLVKAIKDLKDYNTFLSSNIPRTIKTLDNVFK